MRAVGGLRYFVWVIVPFLLFVAFKVWGLPHLVFDYTYYDDGQGYRPFAPGRWYTNCTYVGFYGSFEYRPTSGKCPWFRFYHKKGADHG
ncbi:MAG: hypothetical protein AAF478_11235 [Pseudomonadota bacterium]